MKANNIIYTIIRILLVAGLIAAIVIFVFLRNSESLTPAQEVFDKVTATVNSEKMELSTDRYSKNTTV